MKHIIIYAIVLFFLFRIYFHCKSLKGITLNFLTPDKNICMTVFCFKKNVILNAVTNT
jgi:hypothetical protein